MADHRWQNLAEGLTGPSDLSPSPPARRVLYISGPFSDPDPVHGIPRNILQASEAALVAWREGWVALCPHKNCAGFEHAGLPYETWIEGDLALLRKSDAICMVGEWTKSWGACREYRLAQDLGLPVYYYSGGKIRLPDPYWFQIHDAPAEEVAGA